MRDNKPGKLYTLLGADGQPYPSATPGTVGGNRRLKIYGRLDCPAARRALAHGYAVRRVFFADAASAEVAGYRPCAVCLPEAYRTWKLAPRLPGLSAGNPELPPAGCPGPGRDTRQQEK